MHGRSKYKKKIMNLKSTGGEFEGSCVDPRVVEVCHFHFISLKVLIIAKPEAFAVPSSSLKDTAPILINLGICMTLKSQDNVFYKSTNLGAGPHIAYFCTEKQTFLHVSASLTALWSLVFYSFV